MNSSDLQNKTFHMPAEWEQHEATWLSWPYDTTTFPYLEEVKSLYVQFITELLPFEKVHLLVIDDVVKNTVLGLLKENQAIIENLEIHIMNYMDVWIRDYGPIFVVNKEYTQLAMTKWEFNAWGNKYPELLSDNDIPFLINEELHVPCLSTGIILEGGSIDVNGKGTLLTTEQCLLNKNRNASLTRRDIEKKLADYMNVTNIVWLNNGIEGDDTDGHVDDIARFVNPNTIVYAYEVDLSDPNYRYLRENEAILANAVDQDGKKFTLVPIQMPHPIDDGKRRLPASYMNFYIANGVVVCPTFRYEKDGQVINADRDQKALHTLQELFPERKIIGIPANYFVYGNGAFHCASQQQPKINY